MRCSNSESSLSRPENPSDDPSSPSSDDPSSEDPAMILRIITGENLKDIVDGQLVEEVDEAAETGDDSKAVLTMLRREGDERVAMRRELNGVKKDVAEIKDMLSTLLSD